MRTNIDIDEDLIAEALKKSGAKTKREVIHLGLQALIKQLKKPDLLDLAGKIDFVPGFDHKKVRRSRYDPD
jgi:Arc/MetJ family transcription regulator